MHWNNGIVREKRPTAPIYTLRKEGRIDEAYQIALRLYEQDSDDEVKKALSWVLIDLCKKDIVKLNIDQAQIHFNQLTNIQFDSEDNFVETIQKQISFLKPKIDPHYAKIKQADELSKNGEEKQAFDIMRSLVANNQLSIPNHEAYGWIIYRYIKVPDNNLTSIEVRTLLRDYINLKNERPSMLHSTILNFALNYSKTHTDLNLYNFFRLWDPANLREEDLQNGYKDGKEIPSLISRVCKELINNGAVIDPKNEIFAKIEIYRETILDFFSESYFWKLMNAHKENRLGELWSLFNNYNQTLGNYGKSKWHSEILKLAERLMKENEAWRFLSFFKGWGCKNLTYSDWKEEKGKDGETYKPLAIKALKKSFEIIKNQQNKDDYDFSWLIATYDEAVKLFPNDEWLIREKALLHIKQKEFDLATAIYKKLVLELGDKYYVWQEFAECINSDNKLKIGMFSKALSLEKNEDFIGDIHLKLATILVEENLLENALFELEAYKKHRENKQWKLSSDFANIYSRVESAKLSIKDNRELYNKFIPIAEAYAYQDVNWTEFVLVDKWKSEDKKERAVFINGNSSIEFAIGLSRFADLRKIRIGQICKFKLHKQEINKELDISVDWETKIIVTEHKYVPLMMEQSDKEDWSILQECFAVVDYINEEKNIVHAITSKNDGVFFQQIKPELQQGDYIAAKVYTKKVKGVGRIELRNIQSIDKDKVISRFQSQIGVVDGVNKQKQVFHFVINERLQSIINYADTDLRPQEGDFIRIWLVTKFDKEGKTRISVLQIKETEESSTSLRKEITGTLEMKYKNAKSLNRKWDDDDDYFDGDWNGDFDEERNVKPKMIKPDFAFINNYYVPKHLLEKHNIIEDCKVNVTVVYTGEKWKVISIRR